MECISPIKASLNEQGDIVYSSRKAAPGLVGFQFPCRKCLPCRLNNAAEKAIRCVHEAQMHDGNIFLTLTYDAEHLESDKLIYKDFQLFMKSLRKRKETKVKESSLYLLSNEQERKELLEKSKITYMVTGEYGEKNKRPHWHAIIFNYYPEDAQVLRESETGETVYTSKELVKLWKRGMLEFGSVTMESAGYVARYAAKKLVHGKDQEHDYHPLHKTSSRRGIGNSWIQKHWKHVFGNGFVVLPNGQQTKIPRYYVDWLKKNMPEEYFHYVRDVREKIIQKAEKKARKEEMEYLTEIFNNRGTGRRYPMKRKNVKEHCLQRKFKRLQENLKL